MKPDTIVYVSSVANPQRHPRKVQCLESFAQGVAQHGDPVRVEYANRYQPSRLAVILGWATTNTGGVNVQLRKQIIAEQQRRGNHVMCIDASCWKYIDHYGTYLRYSLNGPFYDRSQYANRGSDSTKWQKISRDLGLEIKPYQSNPQGHVVVCMQRDGGFAMKTLSPLTWLDEKITQVRKYSKHNILVRPHPGAYKTADFNKYRLPHYAKAGISVVDPLRTTLTENLQGAHAAVFFNSSASVAAACEGIPIFADDSSCVSWAVANHDIRQIDSPQQFDRDPWIWDLAAAHWSDEESRQGLIYQKFLPYLT